MIKNLLGKIPYTAELYDALRPKRPQTRYNLLQLEQALPAAIEQVRPFVEQAPSGKKIILFATLHYWVEQAAMIGLALRGMGHEVTIAYLPYSNWDKEINAFDLRRQDLYTQRVLKPLNGLIKVVSLLKTPVIASRNAARQSAIQKNEIASVQEKRLAMTSWLQEAVATASGFDVMYTHQVEAFDPQSRLYQLRVSRNESAAVAALDYLQNETFETVLIPNGLVTELGIFYQVARHLELNTVTYEFNDQREQIWLSQNEIVMRQATDSLWAVKGKLPLTPAEREQIAALEDARTSAKKYGKGTRFWQDVASVGGEKLRSELNLDARPIVLLATNVLGDSLTLGRNIFTASMADWIKQTVQYFAGRSDVQLVVRIHPGERLMKGVSSAEVIKEVLPDLPAHIHLIGPLEKVNTYDLMEIAALGLVYTTTVGMEMAMRGVPVIVAGQTHYRGRGFTMEPNSYAEYFKQVDDVLINPLAQRLTTDQVEAAWNYAYRFFFDFPIAFPWRLMKFWQDVELWPLERVLSEEGQTEFGRAFKYLAGEPVEW